MVRLLRGMNLRNKLMMMLVFFILVPLIFVGLLFYEQSSELVMEKTDKETNQALNLVQKNVDQLLTQFESYLLSIYGQDDVIEQLNSLSNHQSSTSSTNIQENLNPYLRSFLLSQEQIDSVYLIPNNGQIHFADFKGSSYFLQEMKRNPEWTNTISKADGRVVWFPTYGWAPGPSSNQYSYNIPVGMQVRNVTDLLQPIGVLILNVKTETLDEIVGEVSISPNNVFLITDNKGQVVWHKNSELYGTNFSDEPFYREAIQNTGSFVTQRLNEKLYRVGSTQSDYNNWYYFSFIPISDLEAQSTNMKGFFISTIIAFTVLFVMLAWLTSHYITKPIRKMAIAMKRPNIDIVGIPIGKKSFDEITHLQLAFNRMQRRIDDLITEVRIVSEKEREAEIRALHAQINPHVLYNTLDTINWMAIERRQMDISSMITALGDIMRYAIRKHQKLVTLQEEIRWAKNYAYLQKMRFEDRFDILFELDESILDYKVPRLFLQPYLENSIIHGMEHTESGGLIRIEIRQYEKGGIRVVVEDNGSGISEEKLRLIEKKGANSVGINNLDERLKLEYGSAYGVTIVSVSGQGTMVVIMLPELRDSTTGGEHYGDA